VDDELGILVVACDDSGIVNARRACVGAAWRVMNISRSEGEPIMGVRVKARDLSGRLCRLRARPRE
jgi:hypothetical protein